MTEQVSSSSCCKARGGAVSRTFRDPQNFDEAKVKGYIQAMLWPQSNFFLIKNVIWVCELQSNYIEHISYLQNVNGMDF